MAPYLPWNSLELSIMEYFWQNKYSHGWNCFCSVLVMFAMMLCSLQIKKKNTWFVNKVSKSLSKTRVEEINVLLIRRKTQTIKYF